jgi:hypothetical protein
MVAATGVTPGVAVFALAFAVAAVFVAFAAFAAAVAVVALTIQGGKSLPHHSNSWREFDLINCVS